MSSSYSDEKILSIDIGGSRIKATVLNHEGEMTIEYQKIETPSPGDPDEIIKAIRTLIKDFPDYDKVSIGFPGYVRDGIVHTAPNLDTEGWKDVFFSQLLADELKKPVRLVNDADMQGLGVASGKGLEMVVTLGTGFGTALLMDGNLLPSLEMAHHPITKKKTYDQYIGEQAFLQVGEAKWNERLKKIIAILERVFNYDHLYLGGGNSKKINFKLNNNITLVSNREGITGGAKLWQKADAFGVRTVYPQGD
jgi:polyphosphate glucokinase